MLVVVNGLIAVLCVVALIYAGVVMLYVARHDGLPPPFPRRWPKFDQSDDRDDL